MRRLIGFKGPVALLGRSARPHGRDAAARAPNPFRSSGSNMTPWVPASGRSTGSTGRQWARVVAHEVLHDPKASGRLQHVAFRGTELRVADTRSAHPGSRIAVWKSSVRGSRPGPRRTPTGTQSTAGPTGWSARIAFMSLDKFSPFIGVLALEGRTGDWRSGR